MVAGKDSASSRAGITTLKSFKRSAFADGMASDFMGKTMRF
jgi:hypothetical protein